jgi:hypothetical protein
MYLAAEAAAEEEGPDHQDELDGSILAGLLWP